jgi:hypothetical protein
LKRFTGESKKVQAYDLKELQTYPQTPKKAASQLHFYEVEGRETNELEEWFDRNVENDFATVSRRLIDRISNPAVKAIHRENAPLLPEKDRLQLARFVVYQRLRTPTHRRRFASNMRDWAKDNADIAELLENSTTDEEHSEWLLRSNLPEKLTRLWGSFYFHIIRAPDSLKFSTSDQPVVVTFEPGWGNGLGTGGVWATMPLSPRWMIGFRDPRTLAHQSPPLWEASTAEVEWFNKLQVTSARRHIYRARKKFSFVREVTNRWPELTDEQIDIARTGRASKSPQFGLIEP